MRKNKSIIILFFIYLMSFNFTIITVYAQNKKNVSQREREKAEEANKKNNDKIKWEIHRSISRIFETKFPKEYKYKIFPFQFNNDTIAFAVEIISSLDGLKAKKKEKSISVKASQTFGEELSYFEAKKILNNKVAKYKQAAKFIKGVMITNKDIKHQGFMGKNLYISYQIKGEKYGLRIMIYMTNYSIVELTISGPANTMYSYRSDDFFDSIKLIDGITKKENPIGVGWIKYPSKNNIFTVVLPPKNSTYTPTLPKFTAKPKSETMTFKIYDPVLRKYFTYNVYSYVINDNFTQKKVKSILFSKHLSYFIKTGGASSITTKNTIVDGVTTMKTKFIISPTEGYPNITTLFYNMTFKDNILVIQEALSGNNHANSGLNRNLFDLMEFHPERYKPVEVKETKDNSKDKKSDTNQK